MAPTYPYSEKKPRSHKQKHPPVDSSTFAGLFQVYEDRLQAEEDEACSMSEDEREILNQTFASVKCEFSDLDGLTWTPAAKRRRTFLDYDLDSRLRAAAESAPTAMYSNVELAYPNPRDALRIETSRKSQAVPAIDRAVESILAPTPQKDNPVHSTLLLPGDTDAGSTSDDESPPQTRAYDILGVKRPIADNRKPLAYAAAPTSRRQALKRTVSSRCLAKANIENREPRLKPSASSRKFDVENRDPTDHHGVPATTLSPPVGDHDASPSGRGRIPLPRKHSLKRKISRLSNLLAIGGKKPLDVL